MKYSLKKYLPAGLAVIISGVMLFNSAGEIKNGSSKNEDKFSSKSYEDEVTDSNLTSEKALYNLKEKLEKIFNKEKEEETTFSFEETEASTRDVEMKIKIVYDKLLKKYFNKIGTQEISMTCKVSKEKIFSKSEITINAYKITNKEALYNFLKELSEVCIIKTLCTDSQSLANIQKFDIDFIEELEVKSNSKYIGIVDLSNFSDLKSLSLETVNAKNIPDTLEKIIIDGEKHSQYNIESELKQIKNLKNLWKVSIKNIYLEKLDIPEDNLVYLDLVNCEGNINANLENSNIAYISYHKSQLKDDSLTINGNVNERIVIVSNNENVYEGDLIGNPEISFSVNQKGEMVECNIKKVSETRGK